MRISKRYLKYMIQSLGRYTFRYKCKFMEFNIKDKAQHEFALRYYATKILDNTTQYRVVYDYFA